MIIRCLVILFEIIVLFLLQSSVFPAFALAGVVPDLLLVLIVISGYMYGKNTGLLTGFVSGLLVDFSFGSVIGLNAILYMVIGYLAGYSCKVFDEEDYTLPLVLVGVGEFIYNLMYYFFYFLLSGKLNIGYYVFRFMIPKMIYTVFVTVILYKLFCSVFIALNRKRKGGN